MLAQASATRASGQTEKKKRKTEWAGLGILSGPCRTIELQQRHCQHSGPLTANTYSFLRMTSLAADIVTHWKNTERDHRAVSSVSKRKKKKSVSMTTALFKLSSHFCHRRWHKLTIITFFLFLLLFFFLGLLWLIYFLLSCLVWLWLHISPLFSTHPLLLPLTPVYGSDLDVRVRSTTDET